MKQNITLTVLFADIVGSTRLYESLGDQRARELTSHWLEALAGITRAQGGQVVKTIGDELMSTFPQAETGARAALAMQERSDRPEFAPGVPLRIRVGFHHGPVIAESSDLFGEGVHIATAMVRQAKPDQILTTGETLQRVADPILLGRVRLLVGEARLEGLYRPMELCELTWGEVDEITRPGVAPRQSAAAPARILEVRCGSHVVRVGADLPEVTMGRGGQNHLVVPDSQASRIHARISLQKERFLLEDQSTNGTWLHGPDAEPLLLHRDSRSLPEQGFIGLGRKVTAATSEAVHFSLTEG
ncbi:MAG: adenylate/guanylate cyclase domain-containing protein [Magnetococcales bacterium]|nr:adenylate/guanylate cyclase domain-containing protein [Magnetococcales bacterium]